MRRLLVVLVEIDRELQDQPEVKASKSDKRLQSYSYLEFCMIFFIDSIGSLTGADA